MYPECAKGSRCAATETLSIQFSCLIPVRCSLRDEGPERQRCCLNSARRDGPAEMGTQSYNLHSRPDAFKGNEWGPGPPHIAHSPSPSSPPHPRYRLRSGASPSLSTGLCSVGSRTVPTGQARQGPHGRKLPHARKARRARRRERHALQHV